MWDKEVGMKISSPVPSGKKKRKEEWQRKSRTWRAKPKSLVVE